MHHGTTSIYNQPNVGAKSFTTDPLRPSTCNKVQYVLEISLGRRWSRSTRRRLPKSG